MRALIAALLVLLAAPAWAQTPPAAPDPSLVARAKELVGVIAGTGDFDGYFAPGFHAALPKAKWDAVIASVTASMGKPVSIASLTATNPWTALLRVRFQRGIVNAQIAIDPVAPHRVTGLLFSGAEVVGDTFDKLAADFRALPGASGFGVYMLGDGAPVLVAGVNPDQAAPLGSAFKLWVLGEAAREVTAGERKWTDVLPVGRASLPSGILQAWPPGSPVTLQTLATLMISISDNTATDTLVTLEGPRLDRFVADAGAADLAPVLTTRQMFAMKSTASADLAAAWTKAPPGDRRKLLDASAARLAATPIDVTMFASGKPVAIDTLEWFASPAQTAGILDWLRTKGGSTALAVLAVNPGTDLATRARFDYVGFKGGSEPGVVTLNFLVKRKDGRWLAIAANWHRADAAVDANMLAQLANRALVLAATATVPAT